jgi:uncharacterized protein YndB with AHSA1/START domain
MQVNHNAPAVASSEIWVAAPPELVWDVVADFQRWPEWNSDVKSMSVDGSAAAPGTTFRWKAGPGTITSTVQKVDRPTAIGWTGTTMGLRAVHVWRFEPREHGTVVHTVESWEGLVARLLRGRMQRTLQRGLDDGLARLKVEAERRAAERRAA